MYSKLISTLALVFFFNLIISECNAGIQVFEDINFEGESRRLLPFKACLDLSHSWIKRISSVNTEDGCIILCEHKRCLGRCEKMFPGTNGHNDLRLLNLNDKVSSYRNCEGVNDNNIPA